MFVFSLRGEAKLKSEDDCHCAHLFCDLTPHSEEQIDAHIAYSLTVHIFWSHLQYQRWPNRRAADHQPQQQLNCPAHWRCTCPAKWWSTRTRPAPVRGVGPTTLMMKCWCWRKMMISSQWKDFQECTTRYRQLSIESNILIKGAFSHLNQWIFPYSEIDVSCYL